jgi:plasmid stabilization system protein ParE
VAKRVIWTDTAILQRKEILTYWFERTGNKNYSQKLSGIIRKRIAYIKKFSLIGKITHYSENRVSVAGHLSIFYQIKDQVIVITSIWDNRQDPDRLNELL